MKDTDYWKLLSNGLELRGLAYIDGGFTAAASGETFSSINPATEDVL